MCELTSALNTTLSVLVSPSVTDPAEPALKLTTPSTVSVPLTCALPRTYKSNVFNCVSLIESNLESISAMAPDTVLAVVPIAPEVIVPSSASSSFTASTTGPAVVVSVVTSPTESIS